MGSKMSKRDRDLEVLAAMKPVAQAHRAEKRDVQENSFSMLVSRLIGGFSMMMALLLTVVAAIVWSVQCCGDHAEYDDNEWNGQCKTPLERENGTEAGAVSCYHRNVWILVLFSFAVYLFIVGLTLMIAAQCLYGTARAEARQEAELEDLAAAVKQKNIEDRIVERDETRVLREERSAARAAAVDERRERTRAAQRAEIERAEAQRSPYGGARRYSIGTPSTMTMPVNSRPVYQQRYVQPAPQVQYQQRQTRVQPAPQMQYQQRQTRVQPTVVHSAQHQVYGAQQQRQPMRIRISAGEQHRNTRYVV